MGKAHIKLRKRFKNKYVSVSRIKLYEKCALAFAKSYIRRAPRKTNPPAEFGKLEHATLENLFQWVCDEEFVGNITDEMILSYFREAFEKSEVVSTEEYREGLKLIRSYFDDAPEVDHNDVLAVERKFVIHFGNIEVLGYIDRVDRLDNETILVIDYKTNRGLFTREEMDSDLQMGVYGLAAQKLWPWAKHIKFRYDMLRHNIQLHTERDFGQLQETADYVVAITNRIESSLKFEAKLNPLCAWCDHRDDCGEYQEALKQGESSLSYLVSAGDIEKVCIEWDRCKALEMIARKRKEEMSEIIAHHLHGQAGSEMLMGEMRYKLVQRIDTVYPHHSKVVEVLSNGLKLPNTVVADKVLSVTKASIDALLRDSKTTRAKKQLIQAKLNNLSRRNPKRPYVDGRPANQRKA